jgi:type IV pilus assembly protein PilZ
MTDLRRFPRVPLGKPIEFSAKDDELAVRMDGLAKDISLGGMFIETDLPGPVGQQLVVHVVLPKGKREMNLPSVVRWSGKDGMGVQFGLLGARETHEITEFVKEMEGSG